MDFLLRLQFYGYNENKIYFDIIRLAKHLNEKEDKYSKYYLLDLVMYAHFLANYFNKLEKLKNMMLKIEQIKY